VATTEPLVGLAGRGVAAYLDGVGLGVGRAAGQDEAGQLVVAAAALVGDDEADQPDPLPFQGAFLVVLGPGDELAHQQGDRAVDRLGQGWELAGRSAVGAGWLAAGRIGAEGRRGDQHQHQHRQHEQPGAAGSVFAMGMAVAVGVR
jgi:hypothetical protein